MSLRCPSLCSVVHSVPRTCCCCFLSPLPRHCSDHQHSYLVTTWASCLVFPASGLDSLPCGFPNARRMACEEHKCNHCPRLNSSSVASHCPYLDNGNFLTAGHSASPLWFSHGHILSHLSLSTSLFYTLPFSVLSKTFSLTFWVFRLFILSEIFLISIPTSVN